MPLKSKSTDQVIPPLPLETLESYASEIFTPIKRGESVTTIWVPMAGRRIINKFIISYPNLFEKQIGDVAKQIFVYVEPLELTEESSLGYLKLIAKSIIDACKNCKHTKDEAYFYTTDNYSEELSRLEELITEVSSQGFKIVLFLGEFDELQFANTMFYNNLKSLWVHAKGSLQYIFLVVEDVTQPEQIKKYGEINELLLKNIVYAPLLKKNDALYVLNIFSENLNYKFSDDEIETLIDVCGGHPYLLKSCSRIISLLEGGKMEHTSLQRYMIDHFEPRSACQKIYNLLCESDKKLLHQIINSKLKDLPNSASYLIQLGLIKNVDDYWYPFGKLFYSVIENDGESPFAIVSEAPDLMFEEKNGSIFIKGTNIEDKFTRQEYEILRFLLSDPTKLRSRDEIGEAMWGKQSYEKYSDWAIDQVMSKIRKKLKSFNAGESLVTVRGRGYKLNLD